MTNLACYRASWLFQMLAAAILLTGVAGTQAGAHERKHHNEATHGTHMASMTAFTETVPEDYRIMERTPVIDNQASLLSGRKLYMLHCAVCHGVQGRGDGPGADGMNTPPADFLDFDHSAHYGPGDKYWMIARGNKEMGMPGFLHIPTKDIWHMVNYLLALQEKVRSEGYDKPPHKH